MIKIPFSFIPVKVLKGLSKHFLNIGNFLEKLSPYIQQDLNKANIKIESKQYLAMCFTSTLFLFIFLGITFTLFLSKTGKMFAGVFFAFLVAFFILFIQIKSPKLQANRRTKKLDTDLLGALRTMLIQLNSGVPLFETLVITSKQSFGEVSKEIKLAVEDIHGGVPQITALEKMALRNPSPYFRRALWQIINAMKEGSTINQVIESIITNLGKEQIVQIEKYGSQLSPLAMFYMMGAVILPALSITFMVVLASFIEMEAIMIKGVFWGLLGFVVFLQYVFSGIIKTKRPSLLEEE